MTRTAIDFTGLRNEAISHHRSGNLAAAIQAYESLLTDQPDDADCLGLLAMALHQSGHREAARAKWLASLTTGTDPYVHLRNLNNLLAAVLETGSGLDDEALKLIATPQWPASQIPLETDKEMIISAARGLLKIGRPSEAVRLIDDTAKFALGDWRLALNLADIWIKAGEAEKADRFLKSMPDVPGRKGEILLAQAAAAFALSRTDECAQLTAAAIAALPVLITPPKPGQTLLIGVINTPPGSVTGITTPQLFHFSSNSPANLARRSGDRYRFWSVFPEAPDAAAAIKALPRPDLIWNNWVNAERLSMPDTLTAITGFIDRLGSPVLNHPRIAAQATRQRNAERLAGIPGLLIPRLKRFRYEPQARQQLVRGIGKSFGFPVIIRDTFNQMGQGAAKIDSAEELETHLGKAAPMEIYAIEYINNPIASLFHRKIRAAVIGDEVIISHVQFGGRWNVHRAEELDIPSSEEDFANSILYKPKETLGQVAMAALHEIRARVPLDFYGIDFDVLPDGRLVFFEANAAMSVGMGGGKRKGVEPIRARMREALHRLFVQTVTRAPPSVG